MKRILVALFSFFLLATSFAQQTQPAQHRELTIRDIFMGQMATMTMAPRGMEWSPDSTRVAYIKTEPGGQGQGLYYFDPATGKSAVLVAADKIAAMKPPTPTKTEDDREKDNRARYGVAAYHWTPDSKGLLFDKMGHLFLYNLETGTYNQLTTTQEMNLDPKFSPDGKYITFVRNHNLFLRPTREGTEQALTHDTDKNILNGEVNWLYEEELNVRSNYFWSPDSKQILFLQTNETQVPTYPIVDWMPVHPTTDFIKYPKAGDPNPVVKLGVMGLDGRPTWITPTTETNMYIPRFGWLKPGLAWALVLNRHQNQMDVYVIDVNSGHSRKVLTETDPDYLELHEGLYFFKSGDRFLWPSWRDGHFHLYLYRLAANPFAADATLVNQVDKGEWDVLGIGGVDEAAGVVYYTSNEGDDRQQQLYSIKLDGSQEKEITKGAGWHSPTFSSNNRYYIDEYSSLTLPMHMNLCATVGACNEIFAARDLGKVFDFDMPQFVNFKADDGSLLRGVILLPKGGPAERNGKFPLIMNPYGGPQIQTIRDGFGTVDMLDQYFAKQGIAVLKVDNRGMFNRGRKFATATFHNLGEIELKDQLASLDQALQMFPQLDSTRLGWWGWSYGGSMTLNALTHSNRFKAGVAVAPVSDWHLYDSTYTERYMGLPQENTAAYKKTSFVNAAPNLSGRLLIVHGTSDDNVHMQNTLQFINAAINAGKQFDLMLYPQKTHGIGGAEAREHLYTRIVQQFDDAFMK